MSAKRRRVRIKLYDNDNSDEAVVMQELVADELMEIYGSKRGTVILGLASAGMPDGYIPLLSKCTGMPEKKIGELGLSAYTRLRKAFDKLHADFLAQLPKDLKNLAGYAEVMNLGAAKQTSKKETEQGKEQ